MLQRVRKRLKNRLMKFAALFLSTSVILLVLTLCGCGGNFLSSIVAPNPVTNQDGGPNAKDKNQDTAERDRELNEAESREKMALSERVLSPELIKSKFGSERPLAAPSYAIAKKNPTVLKSLFCYCGCDLTDGHKSLLDCFLDEHGATCQECIDEAFLADKLFKNGKSLAYIQKIVDEQFTTRYPFTKEEWTDTYKSYLKRRLYTKSALPPVLSENEARGFSGTAKQKGCCNH